MSTNTDTTDLASAELTWESATTLAELGELTARWLEGRLPETPVYLGGPHAETTPLIGVLAAANRAGYVTTSSQPGHPARRGYDEAMWAQRAAVNGIADRETAERLKTAAEAAGLYVIIAGPRAGFDDTELCVTTTRNGREYTCFGTWDWTQITWDFDAEETELEAVIAEVYQVSIIDLEYDERDLLWTTLATALNLTATP